MNFIVEDIQILVTDKFAGEKVVLVWSTLNTCLNWRLISINICIVAVGFCIAGIIVGRVKKRVVMWFMNEWKQNTHVLDRKTIIWQMFG